jgi:hypothetical protein
MDAVSNPSVDLGTWNQVEEATDPLLIHVGYHKTASSWLQNCIFSNESLGFYAPWTVNTGEVAQVFLMANEYRYDIEQARRTFEKGRRTARAKSLLPVLSNQDLCGYPMYGQYYGRQVAERLHETFPNANILIGIREQQSMLLSQFKQYVRQDGIHPLDVFIGTGTERVGFSPIFRLDHLEYDLLVEHYQQLFGRNNVLVLPMELLRVDAQWYVQRILDSCGRSAACNVSYPSENAGWGGVAIALKRRLNFVFPQDPLGRRQYRLNHASYAVSSLVDRITPRRLHKLVDGKWKRAIERRVSDYYRSSNRRLSELIGMDLARFGYRM